MKRTGEMRDAVKRVRVGGRRCWPLVAMALTFFAVLVAPLVSFGQVGDAEGIAPAAPAVAGTARVDEAVRLQRNIKRKYTELIRIMHDIAKQIASADPDTASAIENAASKAEEALISDDMDRVVSLLQGGLIVPADATQAKIIQRLQEVLKALQGGDELEWLLFLIEQITGEKEALEALVRAQRELERISRILAYPDASRKALSDARDMLAPLAKRQNDLIARLRDIPSDPVSARLGAARQMVHELDARFAKAKSAFANRFPSSDELGTLAVQAREMMRHTITRRTELRTLFNEPGVAQPMHAQGLNAEKDEADAAISRVIEELGKAYKACAENNVDDANVAVAEAERSLRDVSGALQKIMSAMPGAKPLMSVVSDQSLVSEDIEKATPVVERLVPAEPDREDRATSPAAPAATGDAGKALSDSVSRMDVSGISFVQERNIGIVAGWLERMEVAGREFEERLRDPQYAQQKERQDRVAEALRRIVMRNREKAKAEADERGTNSVADAAGTNATAKAQFKAFSFPSALINDMARAMDLAATAGGHLGAGAAAPANTKQNEALKILERVLNDLKAVVSAQYDVLEEELMEQWIAYFYRMVMQQKTCSAETLTIWAKRLPDMTFRRPEQLRLTTVSKGESRILKDLDMVDKLLVLKRAKSGHKWKEPPKIFYLFKDMIREGVGAVRDRLAAYDAGPQTQELQTQVLKWMEGALGALSKKGGDQDDPEKPPQWGGSALVPKDTSARGRKLEIDLLILLQQQINMRVKSLSAQLKEKPDSVDLRRDLKRMLELQANVLAMGVGFVVEDDGIQVIGKPMHMPGN